MLIVPFVNPFLREKNPSRRERSWPQLLEGEGKGLGRKAGRPSGPYPTGTLHFEWRRRKGEKEEEEMDSLKEEEGEEEEGKAFPSYFFLFAPRVFRGSRRDSATVLRERLDALPGNHASTQLGHPAVSVVRRRRRL